MATQLKLTKEELVHARDWAKDCTWRDVESEEDIDEMSDEQIEKGIQKHYGGGIAEFKRNCEGC